MAPYLPQDVRRLALRDQVTLTVLFTWIHTSRLNTTSLRVLFITPILGLTRRRSSGLGSPPKRALSRTTPSSHSHGSVHMNTHLEQIQRVYVPPSLILCPGVHMASHHPQDMRRFASRHQVTLTVLFTWMHASRINTTSARVLFLPSTLLDVVSRRSSGLGLPQRHASFRTTQSSHSRCTRVCRRCHPPRPCRWWARFGSVGSLHWNRSILGSRPAFPKCLQGYRCAYKQT